MTIMERFLRYVAINTESCEGVETVPSSQRQFDLANVLAEDMREIGLSNVRVTGNCFVYAELPATPGCEHLPCMGLIAHMDTTPQFSGADIKPQIIHNYDGGDVVLPGNGTILSPSRFPGMKELVGKTLITTDGTTLLGADDKAGIVEILAACETVMKEGKPHGKIAIAFTPDEEVGLGVQQFDVAGFGADYAYTVDGGEVGGLAYENFNACAAMVEFKGLSVHPGSSKDTMINACLLAMEFNSMLPSAEIPRETEGYEGFFHLMHMEGDETSAKLVYIIRDHDAARFDGRKAQMKHIEKIMNHRWGEGAVTVHLREQYRNMREKIEPVIHIIDAARAAMEAVGMKPYDEAIRGGTDGAQLCYMGLPCPNLCTGGHAFHGPYEHIAVEDMEQCTRMLVELIYGRG